MNRWACLACSQPSASSWEDCPACGAVGTCRALPSALAPRSRLVPIGKLPPRVLSRHACAEPWHTLLGGGLPYPCSILVAGRGGVGKTTELLRLTASIPGSAFLAFEPEQGPDTLTTIARRIGVDASGVLSFAPDDRPTLAEVAAELRSHPRPVVAVDSLNAFKGEDTLVVLRTLRDALPQGALIALVHVTKLGRMRGSNELEHEPSALVRVTRSSLIVTKSRFCADGRVRRSPSASPSSSPPAPSPLRHRAG